MAMAMMLVTTATAVNGEGEADHSSASSASGEPEQWVRVDAVRSACAPVISAPPSTVAAARWSLLRRCRRTPGG